MDLIGSYGSDVEEQASLQDNPQIPPQQTAQRQADLNAEQSKSRQPPQKKRKVLDISILPKHIRKALIHGDSALGDSDDEDTNRSSAKGAKQVDPKLGVNNVKRDGPSTNNQAADPLLAMLPPPEHDKNHTSPYDTLFAASQSKSSKNEQIESNERETEKVYDDFSGLGGDFSSLLAVPPMALKRQFTSDPDSKDMVPPEPTISSVPTYYRGLESSDYTDHQFGTSFETLPSDTAITAGNQQGKKRQREIEHMLMAGDLSVLDEEDSGAIVQEVSGSHKWDAQSYTDQKAREALVYKQYGADGALKSVVQPTKTQNRKHQLTSLAMKAAETEIAMMESHASRGKTKSQTQSRYGW